MNNIPEHYDLYLGDRHWIKFWGWHPDRDLNPQYEGLPDVEKAGATVYHLRPDGFLCMGGINFDIDPINKITDNRALWQVISWEPLTLSPSLLCKAPLFDDDGKIIPDSHCGDHGFVREG